MEKGLGRSVDENIFSMIHNAAKKHNVEAALIAAVIHAESHFNPKAQSGVGAKGLMQINAPTQRHLGIVNIWDARENVNGGAKYLKELLKSFDGRIELALAAYNAGPGNVRKYKGVPPFAETQGYVRKVMKLYHSYKS